jgi:hypothetical protein
MWIERPPTWTTPVDGDGMEATGITASTTDREAAHS